MQEKRAWDDNDGDSSDGDDACLSSFLIITKETLFSNRRKKDWGCCFVEEEQKLCRPTWSLAAPSATTTNGQRFNFDSTTATSWACLQVRRDCQDLVLEEKLIIWKAIHWLFWQEQVETMADAKQQGATERTLGQKRFARLWSHVWTLDIKTNSTKTPPRWFPCVSFSRSTACSWAASSPSCPSCGWLSSSTLSHRHHQIR